MIGVAGGGHSSALTARPKAWVTSTTKKRRRAPTMPRRASASVSKRCRCEGRREASTSWRPVCACYLYVPMPCAAVLPCPCCPCPPAVPPVLPAAYCTAYAPRPAPVPCLLLAPVVCVLLLPCPWPCIDTERLRRDSEKISRGRRRQGRELRRRVNVQILHRKRRPVRVGLRNHRAIRCFPA